MLFILFYYYVLHNVQNFENILLRTSTATANCSFIDNSLFILALKQNHLPKFERSLNVHKITTRKKPLTTIKYINFQKKLMRFVDAFMTRKRIMQHWNYMWIKFHTTTWTIHSHHRYNLFVYHNLSKNFLVFFTFVYHIYYHFFTILWPQV